MLCKLTKLFSVVSSCSVGHRNFVVVENADPYACTYIAFYKFVGQIGRTLLYDIIDFCSRTRLARIVHRFQRCCTGTYMYMYSTIIFLALHESMYVDTYCNLHYYAFMYDMRGLHSIVC